MEASRIGRMILTLLVAASMAVGGIAIASPGNHGGGGPGNSGLFKPGKGCGDKNHIHYREHECKKHHDGDENGGGDEGHGHGHGNGGEHGHGHGHGHGKGHGHGHGD